MRLTGDSPFPGTGRFEVRRRLGEGSFGVVYEAYDRERGAIVALKTLSWLSPETLLRFKREFRSLVDVSHPNLAGLFELLGEGEEWFFTMELVPGTDFLDYVRPATLDLTRLRSALGQLALGVAALHAAGKLHRDLKPSNVRVTPQGRVVLLDFGLVAELAEDRARISTMAGIAGTPAYMAPEQAAGQPLSEAADWYAVGVMLYEALAARLPFDGSPMQVLLEKQMLDPVPPSELVGHLPEDLASLCSRLLTRDPSVRAGGADVLRCVESDAAAAAEPTRSTTERFLAQPFVGREAQLAALEEAYAMAQGGRAATVYVTGESGMGKTALVRRFVAQHVPEEAVVLAGRCYERESVPYKAMDPLVDALTRLLAHLPRHEAAALLPRDVAALARLFPVLRRVQDIAEAPDRVPRDPQELRSRAFGALRELLTRLADRRPVVLFIDDLQWGDADSARMLTDILRPPDPPCILLVTCYRPEDTGSSPMLQALLAWRAGADATLLARDVTVGPLPDADAERLALELAVGDSGVDASDRALIAGVGREAGGSPFFVSELVRHLRASGGAEWGRQGERASLGSMLRDRLARLPEAPRKLLEVLAVAGGPVRRSAALRAAGLSPEDLPVPTYLASEHLVRTRPHVPEERLETYHDRIRETLVEALAPERLSAVHHSLAQALADLQPVEHEALATHWRDAGEPSLAAGHAEIAGDQAAQALAFDRAARWYRLAMDLVPPAGARSVTLHAKLGDALSNAGRGADAAEAYSQAADDAPPPEALEYRRRATEELLKAGYVERGLAALRDLSAEVRIELGRTPRRAIVWLVARRLRLLVRGLRFRERDAREIPAEVLCRLDIGWTAAVGLALVDTIRAAAIQARYLHLALEVGELHRAARALAFEVASSTISRSPEKRAARVASIAEAAASRAQSPYVTAIVRMTSAIVAFHCGRFESGRVLADEAESILREAGTGALWETSASHYIGTRCRWYLGRVGEAASRARALIERAEDHGDRWTAAFMGTHLAWSAGLAQSDDPEGAQRELESLMSLWPQDQFYLPHVWSWLGAVHIALYAGDASGALARFHSVGEKLDRSQYLRVRWIRVMTLDLHARCLLAVVAAGSQPRLLGLASSEASRLERIGLGATTAMSLLIRGAACWQRGDGGGALQKLEAAEQAFRSTEMKLYLAVAQRRRGELVGGEAGRRLVSEADAWMATEGIRNPARMCAALAPGYLR